MLPADPADVADDAVHEPLIGHQAGSSALVDDDGFADLLPPSATSRSSAAMVTGTVNVMPAPPRCVTLAGHRLNHAGHMQNADDVVEIVAYTGSAGYPARAI